MNNDRLSDEQKAILFDKATEPPYSGQWLYNSRSGKYACANCQSTVFDSESKFDSHCGWPSFDKAIPGSVDYHEDSSHGMNRTEVTCSKCGGHLGHVFADGPIETTGQRYCINSLAMDFSPLDRAVKPSEPRELE